MSGWGFLVRSSRRVLNLSLRASQRSRWISGSIGGTTTTTRLGDVAVTSPIVQRPELVPRGVYGFLSPLSPEVVSHLTWLGKKYMAKQDMMLLGHNTELRRQVALLFAEICDVEVEYLKLSRDTTEADLKQRRELSSQHVIFHSQAPVRAALNGRLLILDGLDQVERNVLPALNNLLENREMGLDDGGRLGTDPALPVHSNFRVLALCLQTPPYGGSPLDPPLRSRFSSRFIDELSTDSLVNFHLDPLLTHQQGPATTYFKALLALYESLHAMRQSAIKEGILLSTCPSLSLRQIKYCCTAPTRQQFLSRLEASVPALTWMKSVVNVRFQDMLTGAWESVVNSTAGGLDTTTTTTNTTTNSTTVKLSTSQGQLLDRLLDDLVNCGRHIAVIGGKASGKSFLMRQLGRPALVFPLYSELTSRDLLQRRVTASDGASGWVDSILIEAARKGRICVLDGINRLDRHALVALQPLLLEGCTIDLPSGERLTAHKDFRVVALGEPVADARWITADLNLSFYSLPGLRADEILDIVGVPHSASLAKAVVALHDGTGTESYDGIAPTIRHVHRLARLMSSSRADADTDTDAFDPTDVRRLLRDQLLIQYQPEANRKKFEAIMDRALVGYGDSRGDSNGEAQSAQSATAAPPVLTLTLTPDRVQIGNASCEKRRPTDLTFVPNPLFFQNATHTALLERLLEAYSVGERAFLVIGAQGVGKNKVVDYFLKLLNAEREYIQLHRDSTVNSLTLIPTLQDGRIVYRDSVVISAARSGRILVVDEADKAPSEITFVLKLMAEDGELALNDGRKLMSHERYRESGGDTNCPDSQTILIHPDFRMFILANRPGFPFLGNNFYNEVGGVFHNTIVSNLEMKSEVELLKKYAPSVDEAILRNLSVAFNRLRDDHDAGTLAYPYSVRENVAVVKHIEAYPNDGVVSAIDNVLAFETLTPSIRQHIAKVFQQSGIPLAENTDLSGADRHVHLAEPIALPRPQTTSLLFQGVEAQTKLGVKSMKRSEWTTYQKSSQPAQFASQRLSSFSEHYGTITVPIARGSSLTSCAVSSQTGDLHCLSQNPLTLHTYLGAAHAWLGTSSDGGGQDCLSVELISQDMTWRLGDVNPLLLQFGAKAAIVLLPELGMGISVSHANATPKVEMLTVPLPKSLSQRASLFSSSSTSIGEKLCTSQLLSAPGQPQPTSTPVVAWRRGVSEFCLLDFHRGLVATASLPNGRSVDQVLVGAPPSSSSSSSSSSSGEQNFLVVSGPDLFKAVLNWTGGSCVMTVQSSAVGAAAALEIGRQASDTHLIDETSGVFAGGVKSHGCVVSWKDMTVSHWPRSASVSSSLQAASSSSPQSFAAFCVTDNPIGGEEEGVPSSSAKSPPVAALEVSQLSRDSKRRWKLSERVPPVSLTATLGQTAFVGYSSGRIDLYETCSESLQSSLRIWKKMFDARKQGGGAGGSTSIFRVHGGEREGSLSIPRTGVGAPKHGKEDDKPHVGGNTWAGGSGGSDTAGLGGRGGPYRLDKGHTVHQVSERDKAAVSDEARAAAAKMAKDALAARLEEIKMGKVEFSKYLELKSKVSKEISALSGVLEDFSRRSQERVWLKNKSDGELDDSRLVDGLTGEAAIFKKRAAPAPGAPAFSQGLVPKKKRFHFLVDCSASMYRFNSSDGRLSRLLEAVLLLLEALSKSTELEFALTGHSGEDYDIRLKDFGDPMPGNEKERYQILEQMVSHAQFCQSGDNTLRGLEHAIQRTVSHCEGQDVENFVIAISDANFDRYGISADVIKKVLTQKGVKCSSALILIASRDGEAEELAQRSPELVRICLDNAQLPTIFKAILSESLRF